MRFSGTLAAAPLLLLAACDAGESAPAAPGNGVGVQSPPPSAPTPSDTAASPATAAAGEWALEKLPGGSALALSSAAGAVIRLSCSARARTLSVQVPGFRRIGSEDRLSFGSGGEAVALVAARPRDTGEAGVSAARALPGNLAVLIGGPVSASYGTQTSGPHPAPPKDMARSFVTACSAGAVAEAEPAPEPAAPITTAAAAGPCLMQGSERLRVAPLRATGTEPFWGARIEGRCVTYSHPEDQKGTRVWTRYAPARGGGVWSGLLAGKPFELRTRAAPGCSDGMSDRVYPIAVELLVGGERRRGCAAPD